MIAMLGDDCEDYMAKSAVKWLHKLGINVMTMSPDKKTTDITIIRLKGSKPLFYEYVSAAGGAEDVCLRIWRKNKQQPPAS